MALTGTPLFALSFVALLGSLALTVICWRRGGRLRVLSRAGCILLCEALLLFTGGLAINDSFDGLYPSWSTLFQPDPSPSSSSDPIAAAPGTSLDLWLRGHASEGAKAGLVFSWKPRDLAAWHLPVTPAMYIPPTYFADAHLRFPVVVVVAPATAGPDESGWDPSTLAPLVAASTADPVPAILVFLRMDHPDPGLLERDLPARLEADIRVNHRGWALVGVGSDGAVGLAGLAGAPQRYRSASVVAGTDGVVGPALEAQAHHVRIDQAVLLIAGPAATATPGAGGQGGGGQMSDDSGGSGDSAGTVAVQFVARPSQRLPAALRWVYQQLSPTLTGQYGGPVPSPSGQR